MVWWGMELSWEKGDGGLLRCPRYNVPNKCGGPSWTIMGCFMTQQALELSCVALLD